MYYKKCHTHTQTYLYTFQDSLGWHEEKGKNEKMQGRLAKRLSLVRDCLSQQLRSTPRQVPAQPHSSLFGLSGAQIPVC